MAMTIMLILRCSVGTLHLRINYVELDHNTEIPKNKKEIQNTFYTQHFSLILREIQPYSFTFLFGS